MRELTKAEREIMAILWNKGNAFVQDIIAEMDDPKPANSTVATVLKVLEQKGVVGHEAFGRIHRYFPILKKEEYASHQMNTLVSSFFGGSVSDMVSLFTRRENLTLSELENLKNTIEEVIKAKKK